MRETSNFHGPGETPVDEVLLLPVLGFKLQAINCKLASANYNIYNS
jgi:hypothetical protein